MKITSNEIAKIVGVSRSTVSKVLNNYPSIPEKTRKKVLDAIEKYGYEPNFAAQSLAGKENRVIGVFIGDIRKKSDNLFSGEKSPYFLKFISALSRISKQNRYNILINFIYDIQEIEDIELLFKNKNISGAIFIGFNKSNKEILKFGENYNCVYVDIFKDKKINYINVDNVKGGYLATKYLIENGHREILHLSGGKNRISSIEREKGYKKALLEYNIENYYIENCKFEEELAYKKTIEIFNKNNNITAIFSSNDIMAYGAIKGLKELNLIDKISIIGFDNINISNYITPRLTSINPPIDLLADKALKFIINKEKNSIIIDKLEIIKRESVKKIK